MTLHEAIEKLLRQTGRPMTTQQIADELNRNGWYQKKDGSTITDNNLPLTYTDKKALLLKTKIGIWDVAHKANRKGSLDSAIEDEEPNDLGSFIARHKNLKVIGFNETKPQALFDKYFDRQSGIKYISLPSTSPANTGIDFDNICKQWRQLLTQ